MIRAAAGLVTAAAVVWGAGQMVDLWPEEFDPGALVAVKEAVVERVPVLQPPVAPPAAPPVEVLAGVSRVEPLRGDEAVPGTVAMPTEPAPDSEPEQKTHFGARLSSDEASTVRNRLDRVMQLARGGER